MTKSRMKTYLVGGAVRDRLLGLDNVDRDWVVVGATQAQMEAAGFRAVGRDFPVFLHPETGEEYALARTERKTAPGYRGFAVNADPSVTLEEDLQRRDLTINAMAEDADGQVIDPYGGLDDLEQGLLRHVSPAFVEDPLRVLRVARFAARYADRGFRVAPETLALMREISDSGELDHLVPERCWQELQSALGEQRPSVFFRVLRDCNALAAILPEVDRLFGVPQPEQWHPEIDTGEHALQCVDQAARLSPDIDVRFAALVHDIGKGLTDPQEWPRHIAHEKRSADLVPELCQRLRTPRSTRELAQVSAMYHTQCHQVQSLRAATLLRLLEQVDAFRRPQRLEDFILVCEADARGRTGLEERAYPQADYLRGAFAAANAVDSAEVARSVQERGRADGDQIRQAIESARRRALKQWQQEQHKQEEQKQQ